MSRPRRNGAWGRSVPSGCFRLPEYQTSGISRESRGSGEGFAAEGEGAEGEGAEGEGAVGEGAEGEAGGAAIAEAEGVAEAEAGRDGGSEGNWRTASQSRR